MTEVRRTLKPGAKETGNGRGRHQAHPDNEFRSRGSWFGYPDPEEHSLEYASQDLVIPSRHTADALLDSYWSGGHTLQPFIYKLSFMKR